METDINIFEDAGGRFCLTITDTDDRTALLFEERALQGGGYTWEGVVTSLVRLQMPEALPKLEIGAEGDNLYVYCNDRTLLDKVAVLVRSAVTDHRLLISAIEEAGDDLE